MTETIASILSSVKPDLRLDAELLLSHVINKLRTFIYSDPQYILTENEANRFNSLWQRRLDGEPFAYLVGEKAFWNLQLKVNSATLIPRPETELIIEYVLSAFPINESITFADLGTGCGAIACALAHERPHWQGVAADKSTDALIIARENAANLHLKNIDFVVSDWLSRLGDRLFDVVISNPPYIAAGDPHLRDLRHEPQAALVSDNKGMADIEIICRDAPSFLKPHGLLVIEHGADQGDKVRALGSQKNLVWQKTLNDIAGLPRVAVFSKVG